MDLGGGAEAKIQLLRNMVMLHVNACSNMVANNFPADTLLTLKVVMLHIKLKGMECRA